MTAEADNAKWAIWISGAILVISMSTIGFAIKATVDRTSALEIRISAQGERISVNEARYTEILRRLDSIDRKVELARQ